MFNRKEFEKIKAILIHSAGEKYREAWDQHHIKLRPNELLEWIEFIKEDLGFITLVEIAGNDLKSGCFEMIYHFLNMGTHQRLNVHLNVQQREIIPSITIYFSNADWLEREQGEMLGVEFNRSIQTLILPEEQPVYPLRKDSINKFGPINLEFKIPSLRYNPNKSEPPFPEESYRWEYYDLLSPHSQGLFEWLVCYDPFKVVDSKVRIGFHYQGLEKIFEQKNLFQILYLVDSLNLNSSPQYSITWARTVEEMYHINIPERAQAIRLVLIELGRIADHLTTISKICYESKLEEFRYFLDAREKIYELFEKYAGVRNGSTSIKLGGVCEDLPHGWIVEYQSVSEIISKNISLIHKSLIGQSKFREALEGESVDAQSVLQWGVTGPTMRAAGLNYDLRKSQPFYFYQDIDFDIPVGIHGSTYDRYLIRYEEIFQSLRIITQVIDNLPLGETLVEQFAKDTIVNLKNLTSIAAPKDWHYSAIEASNGEAGFLVKLSDMLQPERIKIKSPSLSITQALQVFVKGLRKEQISSSLASLGINSLEMDR